MILRQFLYTNVLFILISLIPFKNNGNPNFQKGLFALYFSTNILAYVTNYIDFIYYKFSQSRLTTTVFDLIENETNKSDLMSSFLVDYWHVFLLFFTMSSLWILLYKKVKISTEPYSKGVTSYVITSIVVFFLTATLMVGGIRGDFKKSTRPINLVDANRYVSKIQHADFVLNTPFSILRTFNKTTFIKVPYLIAQKLKL